MPLSLSSGSASTAIDTSEPVAKITASALVVAGDLVGALGREVFLHMLVRSVGRFCRLSDRIDGRFLVSSAICQHSSVFDRVGRAQHQQVRNGAQRREMLDRLVRRAVFAEPDRIVRHHIDDALLHDRAEPDRRARIVGEHQERAAIGDQPLVQRHAVHDRRHAVLADAVAHVAPGAVGVGEGQRFGRIGEVRAGEVGRAAHRLGHRRD